MRAPVVLNKIKRTIRKGCDSNLVDYLGLSKKAGHVAGASDRVDARPQRGGGNIFPDGDGASEHEL